VDVPLVTVGASSIELSSGDLPAGLSLVDGSIVGTPTASGTTDVVFSALNPDGVASTRSLTFIVDEPVLGIDLGASAGD
ncbi:putative Ig domain-containing protein, partial [Rhizobium johnstonii]|uniref:putative Ig domain-containing protein n=1 Tax=Rhizobium johnstonii TaxID=3019933 RepID=UPI003F97D810